MMERILLTQRKNNFDKHRELLTKIAAKRDHDMNFVHPCGKSGREVEEADPCPCLKCEIYEECLSYFSRVCDTSAKVGKPPFSLEMERRVLKDQKRRCDG